MNTPLASSKSAERSTQRITRPLLLIAVGLVSIAFALWGAERALAAGFGATLGVLNWFALCWVGARIVQSESRSRALLSILLMGKIALLITIVFLLINRFAIDPIGLAFGLGVLFIGPVLASLLVGSGQSLNPSAAQVAREER